MTNVSEIARWLDQFAPPSLAESWDNVGLLWGDAASPVSRAMTCLTVTPGTADEAIAEGAGLIVTHHPILFRPVQKVTADRPDGAMLWRLARAGVAIYSPHTAFDNAEDGVNAGLAGRFGLLDVTGLRASKGADAFKVIVFAPSADRAKILDAAFAAGAGRFGGHYGECSFSSGGIGTFFGEEGSHPAVGQSGRREQVRERRIEVICPVPALDRVLAAIRGAHSYEEPAIDAIPIQVRAKGPGVGRIGRLSDALPLDRFASDVRTALKCGPVQVVGDPDRPILRVAIGCGAGDDFVRDAAQAGADILVTGEARFHKALEAESLGLAMVLAGHYATERPGVEDLALRIGEAFPDLTTWPSASERDPIRILDRMT